MYRPNPLLNDSMSYKLEIDGVDVTEHVTETVVLSEEKGLLPQLEFSLADGDPWLRKLRYGTAHNIKLSGGSLDPSNYVKDIFVGTLLRSRGRFTTTGTTCSVTALGSGWRGNANKRSVTIPSKNCVKPWGRVPTITLREVIQNTVKDIGGMLSFIDVPTISFTYDSPIKQEGTDWGFLLEIAERAKALVYQSADGSYVFEPLRSNNHKVSMYKGVSFAYVNKVGPMGNPTFNGNSTGFYLNNNTILVNDITVDEDSEQHVSITRPVKGAEDTGVYVDWKLNSAKVSEQMRSNPSRMNSILLKVINDTITDEELNEFFIPYTSEDAFKDDPFITGDNKPFLGRTCNFTIPGNLNIQPYTYYPIYGISRFESSGRNNWWFLKKSTHIWDPLEGFNSELDFIQ